ncbi:MAG TPA: glycosyltransferase [Steroidobacteraceae bacterium]|nr:glycosyltransferase [Steroidobacteraceae bacterium]
MVLKGYPRLSETFIAQEIAALEKRGLDIQIVSMRRPTDESIHPVHREIRAPLLYLPEYLLREPMRVLRAWWRARQFAVYRQVRSLWLKDLLRDPTPSRFRRFGQAMVLACELPPEIARLHVHFLHSPASVTRYAALLRGLPWSGSAHAKDIWTSPEWELRQKLAACDWLVTCTEANRAHLAALAPEGRVELVYHGLDLARFPPPPRQRPARDGRNPADPVLILSVGRMVEKKGFDVLLAALARLPAALHWRFMHVGSGPLRSALEAQARRLGVADRVTWRGSLSQNELLPEYQRADLFALACRIAADGDRDGLPNVLVEAQSQALPCVATMVSAIPELIRDGSSGLLVPSESPEALARAIESLILDPARRCQMAERGRARVASEFDIDDNIGRLAVKFGLEHAPRPVARVAAS